MQLFKERCRNVAYFVYSVENISIFLKDRSPKLIFKFVLVSVLHAALLLNVTARMETSVYSISAGFLMVGVLCNTMSKKTQNLT